jgi:hypothetical protein
MGIFRSNMKNKTNAIVTHVYGLEDLSVEERKERIIALKANYTWIFPSTVRFFTTLSAEQTKMQNIQSTGINHKRGFRLPFGPEVIRACVMTDEFINANQTRFPVTNDSETEGVAQRQVPKQLIAWVFTAVIFLPTYICAT